MTIKNMKLIKLKKWFNNNLIVKSNILNNWNVSYSIIYKEKWKGKDILIKEIVTKNKQGDDKDSCSFIIVSSKIKDYIENGLKEEFNEIEFVLLEAILYWRTPFTQKWWGDEKIFFDNFLNKDFLVWNYFWDDIWNTGDDYKYEMNNN